MQFAVLKTIAIPREVLECPIQRIDFDTLNHFAVSGQEDVGTALGIPGFDGDTRFDNPGIPSINTNEVTTQVLVGNGETVVLDWGLAKPVGRPDHLRRPDDDGTTEEHRAELEEVVRRGSR